MKRKHKLLSLFVVVFVFIFAFSANVYAAGAKEASNEGASEKELIDVTFAVGAYVLDSSYYNVTMPVALGYWKDMGYNVSLEGVGSSTDTLQQLVGGNADFGQMGASVIVQANIKEDLPVKVVHESSIIDWKLAVPSDSDIRTVEDFRGKTIGVFSLTSSGIPMLESFLKEYDIDVQKDASMIAIGFGPQASEAISSGDVDAVMLWGSAISQLENLGHEFRAFRSDDWNRMPDFSVAVTQEYYDANRQTVVDIVKGINMAIDFTRLSPECVVKQQWETWPDQKPAAAEEAAMLAASTHVIEEHVKTALMGAYKLHGSKYMGAASSEEFDLLQKFLYQNGLVDKTIDPKSFYINDSAFWAEINDFDHEAIVAQLEALECD